MTFVPRRKYDIFVSYAHVDDKPLHGVKDGWVTFLVKSLKTKLAQKLGRSDAYKLWIDQELSRHVRITPQITDTLQETAILLVIMSPGYVASEWCQREKETFLNIVKGRRRSGSRVFIVERDMVEDCDRPEEFKELSGYRFWKKEEGARTRILGVPKPNPEDPEDKDYYSKFNDLSCDLVAELKKLKIAEEPSTKTKKLLDIGPTVFLAEVTDDLDPQRDNVKRYLNQVGVQVLPDICYSREPRAFQRALEKDLAKCKLFIQLLSGTVGKKSPDLPQGYARLQFECAKKAGKTILQWRSRELDMASITDADHCALLQLDTVVAVGIEEFKSMVKEKAFYKPPARVKMPVEAFVFVDMESTDRSLANEVCDVLDRKGFTYALPVECGKPADIRSDLEQNLSECDALIVIFGSSTVTWVREHLRQSRKILAMRERPLKALAVYEGPPEPKDNLGFKLANMRILDCKKGLSEQKLISFLDRIPKKEVR